MQRASAASGRLAAIDVLRGFAVTAVVCTHLPFSWATTGADTARAATPAWFGAVTHYGQYGVHLFLVLSGFCIHMQWSRVGDLSKGVAFGGFWARRLRRLYPPYFVALLLTLAGLLLVYRVVGHATGVAASFGYTSSTQLLVDVVLLVLLAQNLNGASQRVGNGPFWSLALEEQLYALYFVLLWLRRKRGWAWVLAITVVTSLVWRAFLPATHADVWVSVGPARWIEWTLGAYAVEAHHGHVTLPKWADHPLSAIGLLALAVANAPAGGTWPTLPYWYVWSDVLFGLAFFVLVNWLCRLDRDGRLGPRSLVELARRVGLVSYSIYLVHEPVIVVAKRALLAAGVHSVLVVLLARFASAMLAGVAFYWLVERRFLHASRPTSRATTATA